MSSFAEGLAVGHRGKLVVSRVGDRRGFRGWVVEGAGVVLTRGTPVYDLVRETIYRGDAERALEIPAGAVVVPGARPVKGGWGEEERISLQTPVIVKYRDEKTDSATALETWLR